MFLVAVYLGGKIYSHNKLLYESQIKKPDWMLLVFVVWAIGAATQNLLGALQDPSVWFGPAFCHIFTLHASVPVHSLVLTPSTLDCSLAECVFVTLPPNLLPGLGKSEFSGQCRPMPSTGWVEAVLAFRHCDKVPEKNQLKREKDCLGFWFQSMLI